MKKQTLSLKQLKMSMFLNSNTVKQNETTVLSQLHQQPFSWRPHSYRRDLKRNKLVFSKESNKITTFSSYKRDNYKLKEASRWKYGIAACCLLVCCRVNEKGTAICAKELVKVYLIQVSLNEVVSHNTISRGA